MLSLHTFYAVTTLLFINDYFHNLPFVALLLLRSGDVETNPGPKKSSVIKFCHWNLNGPAANDVLKVTLIEAFITTHSFLYHLSHRNVFRFHGILT